MGWDDRKPAEKPETEGRVTVWVLSNTTNGTTVFAMNRWVMSVANAELKDGGLMVFMRHQETAAA